MSTKHRNRNESDSTAGEPNTLREDVIETCEVLREENRHCELLFAKLFEDAEYFGVYPIGDGKGRNEIMFYTLRKIENRTNFEVVSIKGRPHDPHGVWYVFLTRQDPLSGAEE